MKRLYKAFAFLFFLPIFLNSQNYGQYFYPHSLGGATLCDALTIHEDTLNPGHVMVGFQANSPMGNSHLSHYNFVIDRTGPGGIAGQAGHQFQRSYQIHANASEFCDPRTRPVLNCSGVSILETSGIGTPLPNQNPAYAIAGAYSEGCFFGILDVMGNCIYSTSFLFPAKSYTYVSQPRILECTNANGDFLVAGSIDDLMYIFRISSTGVVAWSRFYPIKGEPRDMIASAYGPNQLNEFLVVGRTNLDYVNNGSDSFVMKLDQNNGSVLIFRRQHLPSNIPNTIGHQYFNAVTVQHKEYSNPLLGNTFSYCGYFLAGYTQNFTPWLKGGGFLYHVDSTLNFHDIFVFTSHLDSTGGEIVDITSRKMNALNKRVYFSLMKTDSGLSIIRTDRAMLVNSPNFREFCFKTQSGELESGKIDLINQPNASNYGLHAYGTRNFNGTLSNNLIASYFNGITTCNSTTHIPMYTNIPSFHFVDNIVPFGGLQQCPHFYITSTENPGFNVMCGTADSIAGGDNSRTFSYIEYPEQRGSLSAKVYPNPAQHNAFVGYDMQQGSWVKMELSNLLGQKIAVLVSEEKEAGNHRTEIDIHSLGLEKGIYLISIETAFESKTIKLLVEKE